MIQLGAMNTLSIAHAAFLDELEKIAVSSARLRIVAGERKGVRPIRVENFLKKEKDGTLYKDTGDQNKIAADVGGPVLPFLAGPYDPGEARRPKKRGEVPSKDDPDMVDLRDTRDATTITPGVGQSLNNIGATNSPSERSI